MTSNPEKLRRATTSREVAERLRGEIQQGTLPPGARLRQVDVADRFGVSTTPVREAFALLQAEGLLRIDPHRGAIVFRPTVEDVIETYEIREALETLALRKSIERFDAEHFAPLQDLLDRMRKTTDDEVWIGLNTDFHLRLYDGAGRRLLALIASLRNSSSAYIRMYVLRAPHADDQHQEILDACLAGDAEIARAALARHLRSTAAALVEFLHEREAALEGAPAAGAAP